MPSLTWYVRRLRSMSGPEVAWRVRSSFRTAADRYRVALGRLPVPPGVTEDGLPDFPLSDPIPLGAWGGASAEAPEAAWCRRLRAEADALACHRFSFFELRERHLGDPIDWNRDHASGRAAPMGFAPSIDYRNFDVTGDAKLVWEPNRHHQLVVLGRAFRATGERRYAEAVVAQLESWFAQCPFGRGMNWRSPLELAIRLINWVFAVDLIRDSGVLDAGFRSRLLHSAYLHLWEITRKYSRGSSANNHRIGEAAGVFIASSYFRALSGAERWREESRRILCEEIVAQTFADGCNREQALGYHLFVLQFFLVAGVVARRCRDELPAAYWSRVESMLEFAGALTEGGGALPAFGDSDDGYVLDLGGGPGDLQGMLSVGAVLFGRPEFKAWAGECAEAVSWLLGPSGRKRFESLPSAAGEPLTSRSFPDSGYYLLQSGKRGGPDRLSVLFDCGELGFGSIAAHGHADALSFTLRAFGRDLLVDPGTYDYFSFPAWREYFRSTRAHNTLEIDAEDQSLILGPFLWGQRARTRCVTWEPRPTGGRVVAEHDGYARLPDPVVHRRSLELDGDSRVLSVRDELRAQAEHALALWMHFSDECDVSGGEGNRYRVVVPGAGEAWLAIDPQLSVTALRGSESPIAGWVSRGYHRKAPATTLVARSRFSGTISLLTRVEIAAPAAG